MAMLFTFLTTYLRIVSLLSSILLIIVVTVIIVDANTLNHAVNVAYKNFKFGYLNPSSLWIIYYGQSVFLLKHLITLFFF